MHMTRMTARDGKIAADPAALSGTVLQPRSSATIALAKVASALILSLTQPKPERRLGQGVLLHQGAYGRTIRLRGL